MEIKAEDLVEDPVSYAVNVASSAAGNLVYGFAATFDAREDYQEIEELAQRVQAVVVEEFTWAVRDAEAHPGLVHCLDGSWRTPAEVLATLRKESSAQA